MDSLEKSQGYQIIAAAFTFFIASYFLGTTLTHVSS